MAIRVNTPSTPSVAQTTQAQVAKHKKAGEGLQFRDGVDGAAGGMGLQRTGELQPFSEIVDTAQVSQGFSQLVKQMGDVRPPVAAAAQLSMGPNTLDQAPASVHGLIGEMLSEQTAYAVVTEETVATIATMAKTEEGTLERFRGTLSQNQQQAVTVLQNGLSNVYRAQVTARALSKTAVGKDTLSEDIHFASNDAAPLLAGADIDALVQWMMMACSKESTDDVMNVLNQLKASNQEKDRIRKLISDDKKHRADAETALNQAYTQRTQIQDQDDSLYIDSSLTKFEDYKKSQMLVRQPDGSYTLSPNYTVYPHKPKEFRDANNNLISQTVVDYADTLNLAPIEMQKLYALWNGPDGVALQVKFESMEKWLLSNRSEGGVGLHLGSATSQTVGARDYLLRRTSDFDESQVAIEYQIPSPQSDTIVKIWESDADLRGLYGGKIELWLADKPPFGAGLTTKPQAPVGAADADAFIAAFKDITNIDAIRKPFGLTRAQAYGVQKFMQLNNLPSFSGLLKEWGCDKDKDNGAIVAAKLKAAADITTYPEYSDAKTKFEGEVKTRNETIAHNAGEQSDYNRRFGWWSFGVALVEGCRNALRDEAAQHPDNKKMAQDALDADAKLEELKAKPPAKPTLKAVPGEPTPIQDRLSPELKAAVANGKAALDEMQGNKSDEQSATRVAPEVVPPETLAANVAMLKTPIDHTLKQPPHTATTSPELSLGSAEADGDTLQAKYESISAMSQEQGLQLQIYQDRRAKFAEALSNTMKKVSDTAKEIISNFK